MDIRLKRSNDFDRVFKKGKRCFGKSLMIVYMPSGSLKVGYSVGKKHGKAVVRNRIKRQLRAAVRNSLYRIKGNYHIVILPKVKEEYSFEEFSSDIDRLFRKELSDEGSK